MRFGATQKYGRGLCPEGVARGITPLKYRGKGWKENPGNESHNSSNGQATYVLGYSWGFVA